MKVTGLILAAGASKRLGRPKQLVRYQGQSLLSRSIETLKKAGIDRIVVALGANARDIQPTLRKTGVTIVTNPRWQEGMGTTLSLGTEAVAQGDSEAVLVTLCDQPFVTSEFMIKVLAQGDPNTIVCAGYNGTTGVPALFPKTFFDDLMALSGDQGARKLLVAHSKNVVSIPCAECSFDVDTLEDLNRLNR